MTGHHAPPFDRTLIIEIDARRFWKSVADFGLSFCPFWDHFGIDFLGLIFANPFVALSEIAFMKGDSLVLDVIFWSDFWLLFAHFWVPFLGPFFAHFGPPLLFR